MVTGDGRAGRGCGGIQLIPLMELLPLNFRAGSATLEQIQGWAWPVRHVVSFFLPNVFGNPSHHQWFDLWNWQWVAATVNAHGQPNSTIDWGIKNYVEGGNYLGIATWVLAAIAILDLGFAGLRPKFSMYEYDYAHVRRRSASSAFTHSAFFTFLAILSLLFAFGTPLYALLFYGLPGWNQLHSPFRWVFPFTLSMAVLAGFGLEALLRQGDGETGEKAEGR